MGDFNEVLYSDIYFGVGDRDDAQMMHLEMQLMCVTWLILAILAWIWTFEKIVRGGTYT
jgi:uncharacterized membrane protein (DUF106 family)